MQTLTAEFLGKEVTLVDNNSVAYVAMREIVEGIGLDWKVQHRKLTSHYQKFSCGHITTTGKDGKKYEMLCMPIKKLNGWLFSINPNTVTEGVARRDEVKNKLALWQQKKAEYTQRAGEWGKLLQQCKSEKQALERELLQIKQLDLFVNL